MCANFNALKENKETEYEQDIRPERRKIWDFLRWERESKQMEFPEIRVITGKQN